MKGDLIPVSLEPTPVIEAYKKDVDRTLLRENLKLTPAQRVEKLQRMAEDFAKLREPDAVVTRFAEVLRVLSAGRPKDFEAIAELEALQEETTRRP